MAGSLTNLPDSVKSSVAAAFEPQQSVETASPTVPSTSQASATAVDEDKFSEAASSEACTAAAISTVLGPNTATEDSEEDQKEKKPPKKNRCTSCKKKVGLTGFMCRCGGLYCGLHRYSDKHQCTFDYKELAQQQIRKANPLIVGEKINKI